jgi:hypothetical protein
MRERRILLCSLNALALLALAFGAQPVLASDSDVSDASGFGASVATLTTPILAATWTATLSENVYLSGTTYTYVFSLTNLTGAGPLTITTSAIPTLDAFSQTLQFGVVLNSTTSGINDTGFTFGGTSLEVGINQDVPTGDSFTFYAQSLAGPGPGIFTGVDGGTPGSTPSLDPGPEPSSILLFGTGLTALGVILRRRQRSSKLSPA